MRCWIASTNLSLVRYLTSRVHLMQEGEIVEKGDTDAVFREPQHPYTRLLISSIPGRRPDPPANDLESCHR